MGLAEDLIRYAESENQDANLVPFLLDKVLKNKKLDIFKKYDWHLLKIVEAQTSYISIDYDYDVDVEIGDWGIPYATGEEYPCSVDIKDRKGLIKLKRQINNILPQEKKIKKILQENKIPKWTCQKCGRFLGKELSSIQEIKKLLTGFVLNKKLWACRSCKTQNYFIIKGNNIVFKKLD